MQYRTVASRLPLPADWPFPSTAALEKVAAAVAMVLLAASVAAPWLEQTTEPRTAEASAAGAAGASKPIWPPAGRETVVSAYAGVPYYHRSDVELKRPNGTDLKLKDLGWDGDAFYFPIDGGARVVRWSGAVGSMVDFLHNKAIARLGKGAHGRTIKNGIIEDVEASGTIKGQPTPNPLHLTDLVDRLEFTHGHNTLLFNGLARLAPFSPRIRPYFGIGFGVAVPHVEIWFKGESREGRTNEYQYAGPAAQLIAGLELRSGRGSYFIEYKFVWASLAGALTGDHSWSLKKLDTGLPRWLIEPFAGLMELPGDLWRQLSRWWTGKVDPEDGTFATSLSAHQLVVGAGYVWPGKAPAASAAP